MVTIRQHKGKPCGIIPCNYTVVDIETNGFFGESGDIIEIAAVRYRNGQKVEQFNSLVRPRQPLGYYITNLTGITNQMVQNAPDIGQVLPQFLRFVGNDIIVGYNVNFDVNFLYDKLVRYCGTPLTNDYLDVLPLARKALPKLADHKQTTVAKHLGFSIDGAHRATVDCEICNNCFVAILQLLGLQQSLF